MPRTSKASLKVAAGTMLRGEIQREQKSHAAAGVPLYLCLNTPARNPGNRPIRPAGAAHPAGCFAANTGLPLHGRMRPSRFSLPPPLSQGSTALLTLKHRPLRRI